MTHLKEIYRPIENDLKSVHDLIASSLKRSENSSIIAMSDFLLSAPGKRIRPALAILSAKATMSAHSPGIYVQLIRIAAAVELIHMASLLHDDVIDHADLRHNKPTINSRWGKDVAIAFGDYLYSVAFELISECDSPDIINCMSCAAKEMCEGELIQVCERDNLDLLKKRYLIIIRKKTATLFAASCEAGSLIAHRRETVCLALKEYGLNVGIAFQIVDDYLDLVEEKRKLGKQPGQDLDVGELTLPVLHLLESIPTQKREALKKELAVRHSTETLAKIRSKLHESGAARKTKEAVISYINEARRTLTMLPRSVYKESLDALAGYILQRGFGVKKPE